MHTPPLSATAPRRWLAVGSSAALDASTAGKEAVEAALAGQASPAKLLVVLASPAYDLAVLLAAITPHEPGAALVGCTTAGEIAGPEALSRSVVVTALGGDGFSVAVGSGGGPGVGLRTAAAEAARCLDRVPASENTALIVLSDGLGGNQEDVVRGAYDVAGAGVPLVGGSAGGDGRMETTFLFCGGEVVTASVVCAALTSDAPFGIGVGQGWRKIGEPLMVTGASATRVYEIDGRPALDAYLDHLNAPAEVRQDPAALERFAMTHPLGLPRRRGHEVRFIAGADFTSRSLECIAQVPEGSLVWAMEGSADTALAATADACQEALAGLGEHAPLGALAFDCVARKAVLADGVALEARDMSDYLGAPVAGFYTYGEIARASGMNGFHNQTLVILALA